MLYEYKKFLIFIAGLFLVFLMYIIIACSGGGGGVGLPPLPTFDTSTTNFPTFTTTTNPFTTTTTTNTFTTTTNTYPTTTTTSNINFKYLYVKVLRIRNGNIEWLGSSDWNDYAYVNFRANNYNHDENVYVNDGYYGTYYKFYYDRYYVDYVDIGYYRYYYNSDYYIVKIGDSYYSSSEAWYGRFYVDDYRPYGSSIYIVFSEGVTSNRLGQRIR
ncbi:MAG: hypothetical protein ACP5RD_07275 [bacterium]